MKTARAEAQAAQAAYRRHVRAASLAIVFGLATVLAVSAVLPTTPPSERAGLLVTSGLVLSAAIVWFGLIPRTAFSFLGRIFVGASVAQGVMIIMLGLTGGVPSTYFPYYLLPVLVMILSGSWRHAVALGTFAALGIIGLALSVPFTAFIRDVAVTRLFEMATITFFAAATSSATGETRRALAARTEALASQRDDAFQMAVTDELTGLYNRHYMRAELSRMTARSARRDRPFAIISLDVDGLKTVNDERGHQAGDALLRGIADALRLVLRTEDIAVRTGGDEFLVLLPDADRGEALNVAFRIRQKVAAVVAPGGSVSAGISVWRRGNDPDDALRLADEDLYRAKAARAAEPH